METLVLSAGGTLGNVAGAGSDGVLVGALTATAVSKAITESNKVNPLCIVDDGGAYTIETTDIASAAANDVDPLPATPAVDDACYFGHATITFDKVTCVTGTQGVGTWTVTWQYWNGSAWTNLAGVTDGTSGFTSATGSADVTFTVPTDWAKNTVDSVNGYWVRGNVSAYTSVTTQPKLTSATIELTTPLYTDDTTDFNDAGAGDFELFPLNPYATDGVYLGYSEQFCKIKLTTSQASTGTAINMTLKYWNGSAWTLVTTYEDDSVDYTEAAGTHFIHFEPPSDWAANTAANGPDSNTGYFVKLELTTFTAVTQQPLLTQGWIYPIKTGASGVPTHIASSQSGSAFTMTMSAQTNSATNNDSVFLLINTTDGTFDALTWTGGDAHDSVTGTLSIGLGDELAIVQVIEDGTTEFANAAFYLKY